MQRLPVIGQSFAHSAFEAVQQAAISAAGLPISIERWEKRPHLLPDVMAQLRRHEFVGALVEAPHKEKVASLVDGLSDDARLTGAVNVVVRDGDRLMGHNTDVDGVRVLAVLLNAPNRWWNAAGLLDQCGQAVRTPAEPGRWSWDPPWHSHHRPCLAASPRPAASRGRSCWAAV